MTDIKTAMRIAFGPDALSHAVDEIERLNAENERLRGLINAWADAEDASNALWAAKGPRKQDAIHDAEAEIDLTLTALRKAVGR